MSVESITDDDELCVEVHSGDIGVGRVIPFVGAVVELMSFLIPLS